MVPGVAKRALDVTAVDPLEVLPDRSTFSSDVDCSNRATARG
jgi:hypothetical protein